MLLDCCILTHQNIPQGPRAGNLLIRGSETELRRNKDDESLHVMTLLIQSEALNSSLQNKVRT